MAAGLSTRMGQLKQLLPVRGKPVILHGVERLLAAGLKDVVVVLNPAHEDVLKATEESGVRVAFNQTPGSDMAESIRVGLQNIDPAATGILVHLADHPLVSPETVRQLMGLHEEDSSAILVPSYQSKGGHPVLFPRDLIGELFQGGTLRDVTARHRDRRRFIPVTDSGVLIDIDTPADYEQVLRLDRSSR